MHKKSSLPIVLLVLVGLLLGACNTPTAQASNAPAVAQESGAQASAQETGSQAPAQQTGTNPPRTLTVTGLGTVKLTPDVATMTLGVRTTDPSPSAAVEANTALIEAVIKSLTESGVPEEDIQTTNFSIYSYEDYAFTDENGKPRLSYTVENTVNVTVRDLDTIGDLLSAAIEAGANSIWGIYFDVSDRSAALIEARSMAVDAAKAQAAELAGLAGVTLGEILSISSGAYGYYPPYQSYGIGGGGGAEAALASVPVSPGLISVSIDVVMVFEIQ